MHGSCQFKTVFATQSGTEQLKIARDVFRRSFLVQLLTLSVSVVSVTTNGHVVWLQIQVYTYRCLSTSSKFLLF